MIKYKTSIKHSLKSYKNTKKEKTFCLLKKSLLCIASVTEETYLNLKNDKWKLVKCLFEKKNVLNVRSIFIKYHC